MNRLLNNSSRYYYSEDPLHYKHFCIFTVRKTETFKTNTFMGNDIAKIKWLENMSFETETDGFNIVIDAHPDFGGENKGPKPKPFILTALGGCTSMDVVSMLKKMRVQYDDFTVYVSGELNDEHPKYYHKIKINYEVNGKDISADKVRNAVELSEERYCGVSFMLRKAAEITTEIKINGEII